MSIVLLKFCFIINIFVLVQNMLFRLLVLFDSVQPCYTAPKMHTRYCANHEKGDLS